MGQKVHTISENRLFPKIKVSRGSAKVLDHEILIPNRKGIEFPCGLLPVHFHVFHPRRRRSLMTPADHLLHVSLHPLKDGFHPAVRGVSHPSCNPQALGRSPGLRPKKDPLHTTADHYMGPYLVHGHRVLLSFSIMVRSHQEVS
jgi:hypothetical protein